LVQLTVSFTEWQKCSGTNVFKKNFHISVTPPKLC
jgi:hypothetical protein